MSYNRYLPFIGRLFIGLPFIMSGLGKVANYAGTVAYIRTTALPLPAPLAYAGALGVELGCSILLIFGFQTRIVAAIFCLFCLTTAVFFHAHFGDQNQTFHFIKNLVMTGGILQLVVYGAGAFSVDSLQAKRGQAAGAATAG